MAQTLRIISGLELDAVEQEGVRFALGLQDGADGVEDALRFGGSGQGVQDAVSVPFPAAARGGLYDAPCACTIGRARWCGDAAVAELHAEGF